MPPPVSSPTTTLLPRCSPIEARPLCTLLLLLAAVLPGLAVADLQLAPGTSISIDVPDGFVYSQRVKGFYREDADSAIYVLQSPVPYTSLSGKTNRATLARDGVEFQSQEEMKVSGMEARLIFATQMKVDRKFHKLILVLGDTSRSALVTAVFPEEASEVLADPLRAALLTATWDRELESRPFEGLGFEISETPVMKIASRIPSGLVMTDAGITDSIQFDSPLLLVNEVATVIEAEDLESYTLRRTPNAELSSRLEDVKGRKLTIGGLPAYEYEADLRLVQNDQVVRHYKAVVLGKEAVYVFQGTVGPSRAPEYIPQFRDIAHSLRLSGKAAE